MLILPISEKLVGSSGNTIKIYRRINKMFNLKVRNNSTGTHGLHEGKERDYGEIVADIDFPTFQDVLSFVRECQELAELRISDELYTYRFHDITDYGILLVVDSKY